MTQKSSLNLPVPSEQELISSYKKVSDKTVQRSELLKRNPLFINELEGFIKRVGTTFFQVKDIDRLELEKETKGNILLRLNYPNVEYVKDLKSKQRPERLDRYWTELTNQDYAFHSPGKSVRDDIMNKTQVLSNYRSKWEEFCERWHIEPEWSGNADELKRFARQNVEIFQDWDHNIQKHSILISINEWTTLDDIRSKWDEIEQHQNSLWGKKERRPNFARDLIWFDLATKHKKKPSEIAKIWDANYPHDVDLLVLRRYRKDINVKDLGGKIWEDFDLLKEIKSGQLQNKYKVLFEDERFYYITGKIKKGSKHISTMSPFVDVIKKAIKRMAEQISESSMPPLPKEKSYFGLPPQRIS